jgi:hypothetical protein
MATVVNPVNFTITDAKASSDGVTSVHILVGTASGGPYPTTYALTAAEVSSGLSSGTFTGTLASIGENLAAGTYFAVPTVTNGTGTSSNGPEASFQIQGVPSAPTGFTVS